MRKLLPILLAFVSFISFQTCVSGQTLVDMIGSNNAGAKNNLNGIPVDVVTSGKATYASSTAFFTPYATPTDVVIVTGSATKTVKIQRITMSSTQTTAGINNWFITKHSAANTGGSSTAQTIIPLDSANAAATATFYEYTTAPTIGGSLGSIRSLNILSPATLSLDQADWTLFDSSYTGQPIVLRGVAQQCALNFAGAAVPAGLSMSVAVYWTEE